MYPQPMATVRAGALFTAMGVILVGVSCLHGCSSQQIYGAGQAWQRHECAKINDAEQRRRCMESASTSYDQYKRETHAPNRSD